MTITVNGPGGVVVNFPDGTDHATINTVMTQASGQSAAQPENSLAGSAKALGTGLAESAIGLAGTPGDAAELGAGLLDKATHFVGSKLGMDIKRPGTENGGARQTMTGFSLPGSQDIQNSVEKVTGKLYQPQTKQEELLRTVGNFAPAAIGGPGGLATKLGTRVIAPAIASEGAGELTKGTPFETAARIGGAVVGGSIGPALMRPKAMLPTAAELKADARQGYQSPEVAAVQIKPQASVDLRDKIKADLEGQGFHADDQQSVFKAVDQLANPNRTANIASGGPVLVADIDAVRKRLGVLSREKDGVGAPTPNAAAAQSAIRHVNDFLPSLSQSDLLAGDAVKASAILKEAGSNWGAAKRSETLNTVLENAKLNAGSAHSGANTDNAMRQAIKPLLRNDAKKAVGWNDAEVAQGQQVVKGTKLGNTWRRAGNLLGGGGGLGQLAASGAGFALGESAGGHEGGGIGAFALPALGIMARGRATASTQRQIAKLDEMLRSRSPLASTALSSANPPGILGMTHQQRMLLAMMLTNGATANNQQPIAQRQ